MSVGARGYGRGAAVSLLLYATSVAIGFVIDFRLALFGVLALQISWTPFCAARWLQLRRVPDAADKSRFAAGGLVSSALLLTAIVVLTQIV